MWRVLCLLAAFWVKMRNQRCSIPGQSGVGYGRCENPTWGRQINKPGGSRMMKVWFREGRCERQLISKWRQWADGRHEQCGQKRSLLLKRVSGGMRANNLGKSAMSRGRNRSQFQGCNTEYAVCNMTKIVIWRSPRCLFFVTVLFVEVGHTRGGRLRPITSGSPEAETWYRPKQFLLSQVQRDLLLVC